MLSSLVRNLRHIAGHPFNRGREFASARRFFRWQISSRLALGPVLVEFVDSMRLCVVPGMTGATGNIYTGLAEFDDMALVLHALRPGELFIDIGANVGSYTVLAASTGARVIAFEPVPDTYAWLELNIRINDIASQVTPNRAALGREAGRIRFTSVHGTVNHVAAEHEVDETIEVPVITLDTALAQAAMGAPTLIKIDVEGYETEALAGAARTLAAPELQVVIMELNGSGARYGFDETVLHHLMLNHGFQPYHYDGLSRAFMRLDGQNRSQGNTLYVRDIEALKVRIREARRFRVQDRLV